MSSSTSVMTNMPYKPVHYMSSNTSVMTNMPYKPVHYMSSSTSVMAKQKHRTLFCTLFSPRWCYTEDVTNPYHCSQPKLLIKLSESHEYSLLCATDGVIMKLYARINAVYISDVRVAESNRGCSIICHRTWLTMYIYTNGCVQKYNKFRLCLLVFHNAAWWQEKIQALIYLGVGL